MPVSDSPDSILIIDMRFTETHQRDKKTPTFAWKVTRPNNGKQVDFQNISFRRGIKVGESLGLLFNRIRGGVPDWSSTPWPWDHGYPTNGKAP